MAIILLCKNGACFHYEAQRKKNTIRDAPSATSSSSPICTVLPINAPEVDPQHLPVYFTPLAIAATSNTEPGDVPRL